MVIVLYDSSVLEYQASDVKAHLIILKISINKERSRDHSYSIYISLKLID
jgi:hypothetical protein